MNFLSLFSGIGAFEKALDRLGIEYNLVNYCEIDKYASKSYAAVHNVSEDLNLGDITQVDTSKLQHIDMISYGFPCQDISLSGKQKGLFNEDGTQTRSGLFFEALRIIEDTQPKVAIAENVKNLVSKKFNAQFQIILESLEQAGYNNYWKVLNAKDYGIPQNRERVFIVSIRKDIDTGDFKFPEPFELKLRLKDLLESEVDEKFYLSNERTVQLQSNLINKESLMLDICQYGREGRAREYNDIAPTLTSRDWKDPRLIQVSQLYGTEKEPNPQAGRIYDSNGISPTMDSCSGGNRMPKVLVREATKKGYAEAYEGDSVNLEQPNSKTRRGRVGKQVAQTLTTSPAQGVVTAAAMRGRYNESGQAEQQIEISDRDYANAITTVQKDSLIAEPNVLTPKRTEYGKAIRKAYESGEIKESRHNMTELQPRTDGISNTLTTVLKDNYVAEPIIQKIDIPQMVEVRKYPVDCKLLCECLRDYKFKSNFSNKNIAETLGVPLTKVEHWFRQDDCFAIPDPDVWMDLKELLGIETDEFDESIMTFEKKVGAYEKSERHYLSGGISPTITSTAASEKIIEPSLRIRKLTPLECWRLMGFDDDDFYKAEKVCSNTQLYKQAGNSIVVDVLEYLFKELMEVLEVKKVDDKVVVYECDGLINLEVLKEKEPELYEELLADYPCEKATYVFKVVS